MDIEARMREVEQEIISRRPEHSVDLALDRMTELLDNSVFYGGDCATSRSYYFNHSGEATLLRPTSVRNAVRDGSRFPLSDYAIS